MVAGAWRDGAASRLADATAYLRLLDDGKTDVLRNVLVDDLQSMTISLAGGLSDTDSHLLREQIKIVDGIKSVQGDDSDIGRMGADARARILRAPNRSVKHSCGSPTGWAPTECSEATSTRVGAPCARPVTKGSLQHA